jgi:fibronectin type III domain protein
MDALYRRLILLLVPFLGSCDNTIKDHFSKDPGLSVVLAAATNLQGIAAPNGASVRLVWSDNATGETGYRVEGNDAPFSTSIPIFLQTISADSTSFDMPVEPNKTYYIRVYAVYNAHDSPSSVVVAVTTPDVPKAPTSLVAATVSSSRIDLTWANPSGAILGNRVERSIDAGASWSTRFIFGSAATAATDTGLTADSQYFYRVFASNSNGEGGPSAPSSATTLTAAMAVYSTATAGNVGRHSSIAISLPGVQHVAHYDVSNGNLLYTTNSGAPLSATTVDTGPTGTQDVGGDGTGIALDGAGKVHLVAHDLSSGKLRYVTNASGSFVATTLDTVGFNGQSPKIAISAVDGSIHAVYLNDLAGADSLRHASLLPPSSTWAFEDIVSPTTFLSSWSLAIDGSGNLHVSYAHTDDGITYELAYARKAGGSWSSVPVTTLGRPGQNSLAIDSLGVAHIAYYEQDKFRLMHGTNGGSGWSTEEVHGVPGSDLGRHNSIAVNPSTGRIHIAYYDTTNQDLRYARQDAGGSWALKVIDTTGDVGTYTSLGLDGIGQVHISYYDATNGELKVAFGSP